MSHLHLVTESDTALFDLRARVHRTFADSYQEGESRRTMVGALDRVARTFSSGQHGGRSFPWEILVDGSLTSEIMSIVAAQFEPLTAQRDSAAVRKILKCFWRVGLLTHDELTNAKDFELPRTAHPQRERQLLTKNDLAELLKPPGQINPVKSMRDQALLISLASSGARRSEITNITMADVHLDEGHLWLPLTKMGIPRKAWMHPQAITYIQDWIELRGSDPGMLFPPLSRTCRPLTARVMSSHQVWAIVTARAKFAQLPWLAPHDLRRYAVTQLLAAGHDISLVARIVGHKSIMSTARYDMRGNEACRMAVNDLEIPAVISA
jgi:integrase/recombinase XerD